MEKQNDPVAVAPLRDKEKKPKECVRHKGMTRTVVCSIDKLLLCPLCVLKHLKEAHKIDWLPAIDEALVAPPKDVQKTKEYESSIGIIRHEQNVLKFKAANIKNDKTIDQRRAEAILEIDNIVKSANVAKNEFSEKYVAASRKLDRLKLKYEGKLAKAKEDMDPWNYMDEGEEMKPTVRVDDDKDVQKEMERIMMEVKKEAEGLDKAPSPGKDELGSCIEGLKKEVMKEMSVAIKTTLDIHSDTGIGELIAKRKEQLKEVEEMLKQANLVRCPNCTKAVCSSCKATNCSSCNKVGLCSQCVIDCLGCGKKVCKEGKEGKEGCLKECKGCKKMLCATCRKGDECVYCDIYGNTINLDSTDKKYFYCSCNPV